METFATKMNAMRADLASIAHRMNLDQQYDKAELAQKALMAVAELQDSESGWFVDLEWDWLPENDDTE